MNAPTVKYAEAPAMHITYSCMGEDCGYATVRHDGDQFVCTDCGTGWDNDGDDGQLYPEWAGETIAEAQRGQPRRPDSPEIAALTYPTLPSLRMDDR